MSVTVRPLILTDFPAWYPLWISNNQGKNDQALTAQTWQRITSEQGPVYGLGAFEGEALYGMLHYILHPTTGSLEDVCYMQDLFVDMDHRGKGIAKKLLNKLLKEHQIQKWARIYWIAEHKNAAAQALYSNFGTKIDFSVHVIL